MLCQAAFALEFLARLNKRLADLDLARSFNWSLNEVKTMALGVISNVLYTLKMEGLWPEFYAMDRHGQPATANSIAADLEFWFKVMITIPSVANSGVNLVIDCESFLDIFTTAQTSFSDKIVRWNVPKKWIKLTTEVSKDSMSNLSLGKRKRTLDLGDD